MGVKGFVWSLTAGNLTLVLPHWQSRPQSIYPLGCRESERVSQVALNIRCERMRATQTAPRDRCHVFQRRDGFAEILGRGVVVF